jgi:hypothetical protein
MSESSVTSEILCEKAVHDLLIFAVNGLSGINSANRLLKMYYVFVL